MCLFSKRKEYKECLTKLRQCHKERESLEKKLSDCIKKVNELDIERKLCNKSVTELQTQLAIVRKRLKELKSLQCEIPAPKKKIKTSLTEVRTLLKNQLPETKKAKFYMSDCDYWLIEKEEMERFLREEKSNLFKYMKERYDCDDFSFRLMGMVSAPGWSDIAFFIVWGDGHAYNAFVDDRKKVYIIEPQNDRIISPEKAGKIYRPTHLVIG